MHFLTGGAGYCISRELVERGRQSFVSPPKGIPDDIAVGFIVQEILGVTLIEDKLFHSHLEDDLRIRQRKDAISKQVSFGYNNKKDRTTALQSMPAIPIKFDPEDDPLLFQSLRCFLLKQDSVISAAKNEHCPQ